MKHAALPIALAAALGACGPSNPVTNGANDTEALPDIDDRAPDPTAAAPKNPAELDAPGRNPGAAGARIPAVLHGRWGLSPADCSGTGAGGNGLLTVTADELRFYESVAKPAASAEADADSIRGEFSFSGEGQEWTKFITLQLRGQELVRTESNPAASFSYAKCT